MSDGSRLPSYLLVLALLISILPLVPVASRLLQAPQSLPLDSISLTLGLTILVWTASSLAMLGALLAFILQRMTRSPQAMLLFCLVLGSGLFDAMRMSLAALNPPGSEVDFSYSYTTIAGRLYFSVLAFMSVTVFSRHLASEEWSQRFRRAMPLRALAVFSVTAVPVFIRPGTSLPPDLTWLLLLSMLLLAYTGCFELPRIWRQTPGIVLQTLWISLLPLSLSMLCELLGADRAGDTAYLAAEGLKLSAYLVILAGLSLDYQRCIREVEAALRRGTRDQMQSQEELDLSRSRLKAVLDNAAEAIITIDERGIIQDFNLAAERMFGYSRDSVLGNNVSMLMPQSTAVEHDGYIRAHLDTGISRIIGIGREIIARSSDGREFFANLAVSKVQVGEGYLFTGIIHDIDERKRAEISLKQAFGEIEKFALEQEESRIQLEFSDSRLKAVLDNAAEAIITINERGIIQDFNLSAEKMFGYTRADVLLQNVAMLMPESTAREHDGYINAHLETGISKIIGIGREIIARRRDGSEFFANLAVSKVKVGEGYLFTGIIHDIDERKRAEISLKQAFGEIEKYAREQEQSRIQLEFSDSRLKAVLDNAAEAIITINEAGSIQDFNLAAERMFGYTRDAVLGRNVAMLMPAGTAREHDGYIDAHLRTGISKIIGIGREIIARRSDGSEFFANLAVSKVRVGEGYLFTGIIHDIDERKRAEISLKQAYEDIEQSNRELDEFAWIASHDLKEPLRGISNYAQFLLEDYQDKLDEQGQEMLRTLPRLTGNLDKLLNELLEYSRVGRADLALAAVDMQEVLQDVLDSLAFSLGEAGVAVRVPRPLPIVYCDKARVSEVFRNLISNALKYNDKPDPWIEIGYEQSLESGVPVFYVQDNGIGIAAEYHERIWIIFKRLHGRQKFGGGSGVGLSIVKKIIERHEGSIWIESEPGRGTKFLFTFARRNTE